GVLRTGSGTVKLWTFQAPFSSTKVSGKDRELVSFWTATWTRAVRRPGCWNIRIPVGARHQPVRRRGAAAPDRQGHEGELGGSAAGPAVAEGAAAEGVEEQIGAPRQRVPRLPRLPAQGVGVEHVQSLPRRQRPQRRQHRALDQQAEAAQPVYLHPLPALLLAPGASELLPRRHV